MSGVLHSSHIQRLWREQLFDRERESSLHICAGRAELISIAQVTAGLFYGIAALSVCARGAIRFMTRRPLALDDYLLFVAFGFLTGVTGLVYWLIDTLYVSTAVVNAPVLFFQLSSAQITQILNQALLQNIFLALAWTTTFLVKFSFLAFFRQLIRNVASIEYYYWFVVGLTVVSWMFLVPEAFILCSNFGIDASENCLFFAVIVTLLTLPSAAKCLSPDKNLLYISMTGLVTGLDALTDILSAQIQPHYQFLPPTNQLLPHTVVSIPMIVLYRAKMHTSQKLSLGVFLCLSLVMVCLAIIRASKIHGAQGVNVVWEFYWQYMETVVAVIMGSLTVIRNLHVHHANKSKKSQESGPDASGSRTAASYRMRFLRRKEGKSESATARSGLPSGVPVQRDSGRTTQETGGSTLVEDDSVLLIMKDLPALDEPKPRIRVHVQQTQEHSPVRGPKICLGSCAYLLEMRGH